MADIQKSIRNKLINTFAGRTMLQSFGFLVNEKEIEPYFAFKIGEYQNDDYLYFPKKPKSLQYHNFIFNRICLEFKEGTVETFLGFHYSQYNYKEKFLKFLSWLLTAKQQTIRKSNLPAIGFCKSWLAEKEKLSIEKNISAQTQQPEINLSPIINKVEQLVNSIDAYQQSIPEKIKPVEGKVAELTNSIDMYRESLPEKLFPKIKLTNPDEHAEKLIHLYFMLSHLIINNKQVFKMNDSDIKQLLALIYADFDAPYNTVKKKVENAKSNFMDCTGQKKYSELQMALEIFFQ